MAERKIKHVEEERGSYGEQHNKEVYGGRPPEMSEDPFEMEYPWECFHYEVDRKEKIATVTLNNPGDGLPHWYPYPGLKLLERWERDDDVKVVIIKSAGRNFCTGHSLGTYHEHYGLRSGTADEAAKKKWAPPSPQSIMLSIRDIYSFHERLGSSVKPTIARVHGYCTNGGFHFVFEMDMIIASDDAHFGQIGQVAGVSGGGGTPSWHHHIGTKTWREMVTCGRTFSARQAAELGFINRVVPREKLDEEVWKEAQRVALIGIDGLVTGKYGTMKEKYESGIMSY